MTPFKYQKNYHELTTAEAKRLVRIIKNCSEQSSVLIFKEIHKSYYKDVTKRRANPKFEKVKYEWIQP